MRKCGTACSPKVGGRVLGEAASSREGPSVGEVIFARTLAPPFRIKQCRSSWNVACLGASKISGGPSATFAQGRADFGQAAERLAAAGGAEKETRLHTGFFVQSRAGRKAIYLKKGKRRAVGACIFYFLLSGLGYDCPLLKKSEFDSTINNMESLCH